MITEESFIDFKCPHCGEVVSFPKDVAGRLQACPLCLESLIVPNDASEVGKTLVLPVRTPRLLLRRLGPKDWRDLLGLFSDEELFQYEESRGMGEEEILRWLDSDSHVKFTTPNEPFYLGIELEGSDKLIGYLSLNFLDRSRLQAVLNIVVNRSCHRQGYATEAIAAMLGFCFANAGMHRITACCDRRHAAACRVAEKAGLRREGEFQKSRWLNEQWVDTIWFALLDEEYFQRVKDTKD